MAMHYKGIILTIWNIFRHYDHDKYWEMREYVANNSGGGKKLLVLATNKKNGCI